MGCECLFGNCQLQRRRQQTLTQSTALVRCLHLPVKSNSKTKTKTNKGVAFPLVVDVFGFAHREFQDTIGELFLSMVAVGACIVARSDLFAQ
jgi:hypothetical protein